MKKFNPFYILLFLIVFLILGIYLLNNAEKQNKILFYEFEAFQSFAVKYNKLKMTYQDSDIIINMINDIAKKSSIRNINLESNNNFIKVDIDKGTFEQYDSFLNKLFNTKLNIVEFVYKDQKISFKVGIL